MSDYTPAPRYRVSLPPAIIAGLVWSVLGVLLVFAARAYLPDKYFFDNATLLQVMHYTSTDADGSFGATARLYQWMYPLGVPDSILVGVVNYLVVVVITVTCMLLAPIQRRWRDLAWLTSWTLMAAIFTGMLSKDFFTIIVAALVLVSILRGGILGWATAISAILIYGVGVRAYWVAILPYGFILMLLIQRGKPTWGIAGFIAMLLFASFSFHMLTGFYLTDVRAALNLPRLDSANVTSMIMNPLINTSVLTDVVNQLWAWLNFLFPIRLLLSGVLQQAVFAAWQVGNIIVVGTAVFRARQWLRPTQFNGILAFVCAVTLILATFDGDFGSYTRHQIALLPMVAFLLGAKTLANKNTTKAQSDIRMSSGLVPLAVAAAAANKLSGHRASMIDNL